MMTYGQAQEIISLLREVRDLVWDIRIDSRPSKPSPGCKGCGHSIPGVSLGLCEDCYEANKFLFQDMERGE